MSQKDIQRHGWHTIGCPGCEAANRGEPSKNHTETCRKAYEQMLQHKDPEKYAKDKDKENKRLAKMMEEQIQEDRGSKKQKNAETPTGSQQAREIRVNAAGGVEQQGGASASGHAVNHLSLIHI